ncbi:MAG: hypothetical protein N0E56_16210 [Candidatus Thiodiazotropha endolucinida]|nr:hypothetical protein [Candidatus Thiodiazotropha taylori]MCW4268169.1 hypothetical protein [Candidatus Thiodiazotropha endolucinida]
MPGIGAHTDFYDAIEPIGLRAVQLDKQRFASHPLVTVHDEKPGMTVNINPIGSVTPENEPIEVLESYS